MNKIQKIFRIFCLFLLSLTLSTVLYSQEKTKEIVLDKKLWTVGISRFSAVNLEDRQLYLQSSLPQLLKENINDLKVHELSEEEISFLAREYLDTKITSLANEISSLYTQRDKLLFSGSAPDKYSREYRDKAGQIGEKAEELQLWKEKDPSEIKVAETLALEYKENEQSPSQVVYFLEKNDQDMLISGSVERLDDYFYLEIFCHGRRGRDPLFRWSAAGREDELNTLIGEAGNSLRALLLGRSWAGLNLRVEPEDSIIRLDGVTVGVGSVILRSAQPGFRTLQISRSAYKTHTQQIYLASMETNEMEISLEEGQEEVFSYLSDPPGADVYYGSTWMGITPLQLPLPGFSNNVKIDYQGYVPFHISSRDLTGQSITVRLDRQSYDRQMAFDNAKSDFYRSLGWFSLSMGVPLILYGIYQNQYSMYYNYAADWILTADPDSYNSSREYADLADRSYYGFLGGVAISGGLLINTLIKLNRYIKAAEESTEY